MLRLKVLGFLLACAVSLSSSAVIVENGLPIQWAQTAGQVSDLPTQNGIVTPDPWNFLQRMGLYRLIITATDPFMGSMGTNSTDNPLWGLALQLAWMQSSGRFADPTGATTCGLQTGDTTCISTQSWWGCVNYFLSALPFLSAAQKGFEGPAVQVQMQVPTGVQDYCTTYADCAARYPDVMSKWDAFFEGLRTSTGSPLPDNEKKDSLLGLYWEAQMASIQASSACNDRQSHYSSVEMSFANSWLDSADYVAAVRFHSSLEKSLQFISPLPSRVLQVGDSPPNIADLSEDENRTLKIFNWMKGINTLLAGSVPRLWRRAMCSVTTRETGREMLEQLLLNPIYSVNSFLSFIVRLRPSC